MTALREACTQQFGRTCESFVAHAVGGAGVLALDVEHSGGT